MVKKPSTIEKFIDNLAAKMHDKGQKEFEEVLSYKRQLTKNKTAVLEAWDFKYYSKLGRKLIKEKQPEKVGEPEPVDNYFTTDHVVAETLVIYQELLGLKF